MRQITITYPQRLRLLWKKGKVHEAWYWEHDGLFDEDDLRYAKSFSPNGFLFGEWFTAIHFFRQGYKVLNESYALRPHREKRAFLAKVLDKTAFALITGLTLNLPDLFVYDPKNDLFFFVEVKLGSDRLSKDQEWSFREIEKRLGCLGLIVKLKAFKR